MALDTLAVDADARKRYWSRVKLGMGDGCWLWLGTKTEGYGSIIIGGRSVKATHVAVYLDRGAVVPDGMCALHSCDTPPCVNPDHLRVGTRTDNSDDKCAKGRQCQGEGHPDAKLTEAAVVEIVRRVRGGETRRSVAGDYGVTPQYVGQLAAGKNWKHLAAFALATATKSDSDPRTPNG